MCVLQEGGLILSKCSITTVCRWHSSDLLLHLLGVVAHFVLVDGAVMAHVSVVGHDEDGNVRRNTRQFALDVVERPGAQLQTHRA